MTTETSVFLIEDDEVMRSEFERMIDAHSALKLIGRAGTLAEARRQLQRIRPDVAIVDLGLPDGDGTELIGLLRERSPDTAVLVSTVFGDEAHVVRALEAGARGYLLKDTTLEDFADSILLVKNGDAPLSPRIARYLLKRFEPRKQPARRETWGAEVQASLTAREIDILTSISSGFSVAETSANLCLSPHTVKTHIKNIYGKLSVSSRIQAVNEARQKGFIA
ncbi:response regulator [Trinickia diaoshuihuensis]|uniref:response regulator n=1 Tax=Trinickia diaoshuihuensis TaxID=2292265 RepID=UPI000E256496|nr:response regulator transcription factor [Trinickia diaoshuihuensis]